MGKSIAVAAAARERERKITWKEGKSFFFDANFMRMDEVKAKKREKCFFDFDRNYIIFIL